MFQDTESEGEQGGGLFDSLGSLQEHRCFRLSCAEQPECVIMDSAVSCREPSEEFSEVRQLPNGCAVFQVPAWPGQHKAMAVHVPAPDFGPVLQSDVTVTLSESPEPATSEMSKSLLSLACGPQPNIRARLQLIEEDRARRKLSRPRESGPLKCKKKKQKRKASTKKSKQKENVKPRRLLPRRECCDGSSATREPMPEPEPEPKPEAEPKPEPEREPEAKPEPGPEAEPEPGADPKADSLPEPGPEQNATHSEGKILSPAMSSSSKSDKGGRIRLPEKAVSVLNEWLQAHPKIFKPPKEAFELLVKESGLKPMQVCTPHIHAQAVF